MQNACSDHTIKCSINVNESNHSLQYVDGREQSDRTMMHREEHAKEAAVHARVLSTKADSTALVNVIQTGSKAAK